MSTEFSQFNETFSEGSKPPPASAAVFDIKRFLYARLPIVIIISVVIGIPAILGAWFLTPLEYEASATLRFLAVVPRVLETNSQNQQAISYEKYVNTQIALIQSDTVLMRVLDDPRVANLQAIQAQEDPLKFLKGKVSARPSARNSELVTISMQAPDRQVAQTIVASVVSSYLEYAASTEATAGGKRMEALQNARDNYQHEYDRLLGVRADLTRKLEAPKAQLNQLGTTVIDIQREALVRAEENHATAQANVVRIEEVLLLLKKFETQYNAEPNKPIYDFGIEERLRQDSRIAALRTEEVNREAELQTIRAERTEQSLFVKSAEEELNAVRQRLKAMEAKVRGEILRTLLVENEQILAANNEIVAQQSEMVEKRKKEIEGLEKEYQARSDKIAEAQAELDELDISLNENKRLLSEVRQQIDELSLESNAPARVQLSSGAVANSQPESKKRLALCAMSLLASIMLGAGVGVLLELSEKHVYSPKDIAALTGYNVLAAIPHTREDPVINTSDYNSRLIAADFPYSATANEYRRVLSRVIYPPDGSLGVKSILVTSASRGDGKTSVACNLAIMLAHANRRVLLVDACGYKPMIESCFELERDMGLSEILFDGVDPMSLIRSVGHHNLDVLGPGLRAKDISNKLVSREMMDTIELFEQEYDHIIFDTVPALLMSDAKLLAPVVSGVIVVIGAEVSLKGMIPRLMNELNQVNADIIGVVMNKLKRKQGGYLRKNQDLYYNYSSQSQYKQTDEEDAEDLPEIQIIDDEDEEEVLLLAAEDNEKGEEEEHL